ncbi:hypothetical protein Dimus_026865 [Dionaea muscipula]
MGMAFPISPLPTCNTCNSTLDPKTYDRNGGNAIRDPADRAFLFAISSSCHGSGDQLPCVKRLMPCHQYLHSNNTPPASCCVPLNELIAKDKPCLCTVFNNPALLKSLNLTQDQALLLPKHCGVEVDISKCNTTATPPTGPPSPPSPPAVGTAPPSGSGSKESSASGMSQGSSIMALVTALAIAAFSNVNSM